LSTGDTRDQVGAVTELILAVTLPDRRARIPRLAHEFALACRHASTAEAVNRMLRDHNRRAVRSESRLPKLGEKGWAFREHAVRQWLAAFDAGLRGR
jgi:hypothetical protein